MSDQTTIRVPSGQPVHLQEVITGHSQHDGTLFFRFVAPELGAGEVDYARLEPDLLALCRDVALPYVSGASGGSGAQEVRRVVISLSQRPVAFGAPAPEVSQVFEAYGVADGSCEWEPL